MTNVPLSDGRDHVPCCIRERIPDLCQDLCRGEYTLVTDNVKTHFSCPSHIERTLSCIADGVGKFQIALMKLNSKNSRTNLNLFLITLKKLGTEILYKDLSKY